MVATSHLTIATYLVWNVCGHDLGFGSRELRSTTTLFVHAELYAVLDVSLSSAGTNGVEASALSVSGAQG